MTTPEAKMNHPVCFKCSAIAPAIITQDTWEDYEVHEHYEAIDTEIDTEGANDITSLIINAMKIE